MKQPRLVQDVCAFFPFSCSFLHIKLFACCILYLSEAIEFFILFVVVLVCSFVSAQSGLIQVARKLFFHKTVLRILKGILLLIIYLIGLTWPSEDPNSVT